MATECELKHALTVLVDMVEMYAPSLAKSGGWVRAKELVSRAPAQPPDYGEGRTFMVEWAINVHAGSPELAARYAWHAMRKPGSVANVFDVLEEGKDPVRVDLNEIDQERAS